MRYLSSSFLFNQVLDGDLGTRISKKTFFNNFGPDIGNFVFCVVYANNFLPHSPCRVDNFHCMHRKEV
jgi:hypothetical protein